MFSVLNIAILHHCQCVPVPQLVGAEQLPSFTTASAANTLFSGERENPQFICDEIHNFTTERKVLTWIRHHSICLLAVIINKLCMRHRNLLVVIATSLEALFGCSLTPLSCPVLPLPRTPDYS